MTSGTEVYRKELTIDFDVKGQSKCLRITNTATGKHVVLGVNDDYMFHLDRHLPDVPYSISRCQAPGAALWRSLAQGEPEFYAGEILDKLLLFLNSPFAVHGVPLQEIVASSGFELSGIDEYEDDGLRLVRLRYDFDSGLKDIASWQNASVVMLPDNRWAVVRYEGRAGSSWIEATVEYAQDRASLLPTRVHHIVTSASAPNSARETEFGFDEIRQAVAADETFRLGTFGLPEPDWLSGGNARRWLVSLFVVNAVAALIALTWWMLRWRRHKRTL